jgi:3-deoxy-7-phosphoheptulonate synthase
VKKLSHLPIIVDPSHAAGVRDYVAPLALASVAVGADGMMIEVHPHPEKALCDGPESLSPDEFDRLMKSIRPIARAVGRKPAR